MDDAEYHLREIEEKLFEYDIQAKNDAERAISNLELMTAIYKSSNNPATNKLAREALEDAYETARLGLKDLMRFGYSNDLKREYMPKYNKAIYAAQRAVCPELFMDASQVLKREQAE